MIIKGKSRSGPVGLAQHLGNAEKNERIQLLETRGTIAIDLQGALVEMDAVAAGTRCQRPLYHAAISPEPPHRLSPSQRLAAIDALERRLGFEGQPRVVMLHEKEGREHLHVVWSRIDVEHMRAIPDSHNYRKHEEVARDLERRFGHDRVQGAHHERGGEERPPRSPSRSELRQEERTGIRGRDVRSDVTAAYRASDGPEAFERALADKGYLLARGDRRDFVVIDRAGGVHSLARRIEGVRAAELRQKMSSLDPATLMSVEEVQRHRESWQQRGRTSDVHDGGLGARRNYVTGADYVSQSRAALREARKRQEKLNEFWREINRATDPPDGTGPFLRSRNDGHDRDR